VSGRALGANQQLTQYRRRFIAFLLVVLGLNAEQALDEFIELSVVTLEKHDLDAPARTAALKVYVDELLKRYKVGKKTRLLDTNVRPNGSKLCVI
jgi:hypothetical protein